MLDCVGRGDWIRTSDPLRPRQVRYRAALRPDILCSFDSKLLLRFPVLSCQPNGDSAINPEDMPNFVAPKSGGWRREKRPKQLKRPGISTAAHFTVLVTTDFVPSAVFSITRGLNMARN